MSDLAHGRDASRRSLSRRLGEVLVAAVLSLLGAEAAWANVAPVIDSLSASAVTVPPGGTVDLTALAHDPDCSGTCTSGCGLFLRADLTQWTATGGTFTSRDNGASVSPYTATAVWEAPATEDTYTITVHVFDSGTFLCGGRLSATASVEVLVTTTSNQPPQVQSVTASPLLIFPGETSDLVCTAVDPDGDPLSYSWTADSGSVAQGSGGTAVFTAGDPGLATVTCTATDTSGAFASGSVQIMVAGAQAEKEIRQGVVTPQRLSVDSEGSVYIVDRAVSGLTVLNLASGEVVHTLTLADARSVAVDWNDQILVGTASGAAVLDRRGRNVVTLSSSQPLDDVSDVAVDPARHRYGVLLRKAGRVLVFDDQGAPIAAFGSAGSQPDQMLSPQGLAVTPEGRWVVADTGNGLVKVFDLSGALVSSFGGKGGGIGEFVQLDDVAVDSSGVVYASDSFQDWVQAFDPDGTPREAIGTYGEGVGVLKTAAGIAAADAFDRLLVASPNSSSVQVFVTQRTPAPPGALPSPVLSATSLAYPSQVVGTYSAPRTVTLANHGGAPLGVRRVLVTGDFVTSHDCGAFVDPNSSCDFEISFAPADAGASSGFLLIETSAEGGALVVKLSGSAYVPPSLQLYPEVLDFPDTDVGTVGEPYPVAVSNLGTVAVLLYGVSVSESFVQSNDCGSVLPAGATCTVQVRFAPTVPGDHVYGTLTVASNAFFGPHMVGLDGRAVQTLPEISISDRVVREGDSGTTTALFTVSLSAPSARTVDVSWTTVPATALEGEDFEPASGTLAIPPGATQAGLSVEIVGDGVLEPDEETFIVELSAPAGGVLANGRGIGTILDDESCAGPNLLANGDGEERPANSGIPAWTEAAGMWQRREERPAPHTGGHYLFAGAARAAELYQDVDLSAFASAIDAGVQRFVFEGWVRSAAESRPDTARIVIEYRNLDNTAVLDAFDSGEIASTGAWQEVADERVVPRGTGWTRVRLISARNSGTGNNAYFDALALRSLRAPTIEAGDASAYEGSAARPGEIVFPITLSCPVAQEVIVDYETSDGTAAAGIDYEDTAGSLEIARGDADAEVRVPALGNDADEPHKTVDLDLRDVVPGEIIQLNVHAQGTIVNDDFCQKSAAWWRENPDRWPVDFLEMGGAEYGRGEISGLLGYSRRSPKKLAALLQVLRAALASDGQGRAVSPTAATAAKRVPRFLAEQLAAAMLNLSAGSDPSIAPIARMADAWLERWPPGSAPPSDTARRGLQLSSDLDSYNGGHCP